jgi:hypothetical protein
MASTQPTPSPFGHLLRRWRRAAGLSLRGVSDLERINRAPRRETVHLLADALHLTPQDRAAFEAAARLPVIDLRERLCAPRAVRRHLGAHHRQPVDELAASRSTRAARVGGASAGRGWGPGAPPGRQARAPAPPLRPSWPSAPAAGRSRIPGGE